MPSKDDKPQAKAKGDASTAKRDPQDDLMAKVKAAQAQDAKMSEAARFERAEWEKQIKELTEQVAKLTDIAARSQAELQNAKIRLERESADMRKFAAEAVLLKLLPTIDNFQRAFKHLPEDLKNHEWVKGITAVEQDLMKRAGEMGLKKFDSVGQKADANRHEVLTVGPGKEGEVIEVFEDGYELQGKVLRPAKVKVGSGLV